MYVAYVNPAHLANCISVKNLLHGIQYQTLNISVQEYKQQDNLLNHVVSRI